MARTSDAVRAAGVVVFHPDMNPDRRFLAVHRPHREDWSLPKGKVDVGEPVPCAAVRECDEETGYRVSLAGRLPSLTYQAAGVDKVVDYWVGRVRGDEGFAPDEEVDEIRWIPVSQAQTFLTYPDDAHLVSIAADAPETSPLIVLRHAKAMKRADFDGKNDADRPLSGRGRSEAKRLAELLDAFDIQQVHSSPFRRCLSTVARYAKSIGVEVQLEPTLSEFDHADDPTMTEQRVAQLIEVKAPIVLCTHRPVLPTIFAALASGLDVDRTERMHSPEWDSRLAPGGMVVIHRMWTADGPRAYAIEQHELPRA